MMSIYYNRIGNRSRLLNICLRFDCLLGEQRRRVSLIGMCRKRVKEEDEGGSTALGAGGKYGPHDFFIGAVEMAARSLVGNANDW